MSTDSERLSVLEREYENAREHLNQQHESLDTLSKNSYRMARLLFLFAGIIATILSAIGEVSLISDVVLNDTISKLGASLILSSSIIFLFSAMGERVLIQTIGKPVDLSSARNHHHDEENFLLERLRDYEARIKYNSKLIDSMGFLVGTGGISLVVGVLFLSYSILDAASPGLIPFIGGLTLLIVIIIFYLANRKMPEDVESLRDDADSDNSSNQDADDYYADSS